MAARNNIPEFLFRGAVVEVDGEEKVLHDLCLARPEDKGRRAEGDVLVLQFRDGEIVEYDPDRVREVHGRAPDFIRVGAEIFWRETRKDLQEYNGVWTIESYRVERDPLRGAPHTRVDLSLRRQQGAKSTYLTRVFNAETMHPVKQQDAAPADLQDALKKDVKVLRPIRLKTRKGP